MISLSAPGKTFLCGEYLALRGGPSVVLSTAPRFQLRVSKKLDASKFEESKVAATGSVFHEQSPAGHLLAQYPEFFAKYEMDFKNPYGQGGFGGSTAEFLLLKAVHQFGDGLWTEHQLDLDVRAVLSEYRELHKDKVLKPSGADLVGQACGAITGFDRRAGRIQLFRWSFPHLGFVLFATGLKVPTHEHLSQFSAESELEQFEALDQPCQKVWDALSISSEGQFLIGLNEVSRQLEILGLQDDKILARARSFRAVPGVRAAKGCGALGADVMLVVFDRREIRQVEVIERGESWGLKPVATEAHLTGGLEKDPAGESLATEGKENAP